MKSIQQLREENENLRREIAVLNNTIKELTSALDSSLEHVIRKRELLLHTAEEIDSIPDESLRHVQDHLRRLPKEIRSQVRSFDELDKYEKEVLSKREKLLTSISQYCPELTPSELIICWHLSRNHTTKEIATLTRNSERTVEWHRTSIRKKLKLDKHNNLSTFLINLITSETKH